MCPTLSEDEERGMVVIDDIKISGFLVGESACPTCGARIVYDDLFDATLCATCNVWLESRCANQACRTCADRPELPLDRVP
jgi:hypothetical protein